MSETITASLTVSGGDTITAEINTLARGPVGPAGEGGSGAITSATTSDGTADLSISNVTTATAEVTGTLTANHIHGNLAGNVYAHIRAGEDLAKGDPVYVSGSHGSGSTLIAIVSKADASNAAKMPAVGIMDSAVANKANGHMVITGTITELATNAYSINAELYVAAGGGMTATPPTALAQPVARVERSNLNNGAILVKVNGLSASDATPSTLVRRTSEGAISVNGMIATGGIEFNGNDAEDSMTFNQVYYYYGAGAASAHRTALGSGATGDELFTAASPAAARVALGVGSLATFTATDNQPPATAFATLDTRNSIAVLDFDAGTDESAIFVGIIPQATLLGSGLKIRLQWMATSATSGNVVWDVSLERMNTDLDSDSFDTIASGTAAANGTSGILTVTEITLTTIDSVAAGDGYRLKVTRDANNASDTMTGDAELVVVEIRSAT